MRLLIQLITISCTQHQPSSRHWLGSAPKSLKLDLLHGGWAPGHFGDLIRSVTPNVNITYVENREFWLHRQFCTSFPGSLSLTVTCQCPRNEKVTDERQPLEQVKHYDDNRCKRKAKRNDFQPERKMGAKRNVRCQREHPMPTMAVRRFCTATGLRRRA
jgi:hypothetical protein